MKTPTDVCAPCRPGKFDTRGSHLFPTRSVTRPESLYRRRLAVDASEVRAAQALRFQVFNLELNEGLEESRAARLDVDAFDTVCDHLVVEHVPSESIVGTYRLQTGRTAATQLGYYSEQEFDFSPYEKRRDQMVELGRACVHPAHRNLVVLGMLWKGIVDYAIERSARYLCGCSSLPTQDPAIGASAYTELVRNHLIEAPWRTSPLPAFECPLDRMTQDPPKIPKLLRAYLSIGGKICGPPALDRRFKTIDFLTLVDLQSLPTSVRSQIGA